MLKLYPNMLCQHCWLLLFSVFCQTTCLHIVTMSKTASHTLYLVTGVIWLVQ